MPFDLHILNSILRSDLKAFLEKSFETLNPGIKLLDNWHIDAICHQLMRVHMGATKRLIITLPPRSLKSITVSVAFPAWLMGLDSTRRIIAVSYSDLLAAKLSRDTKNIMIEPWYQKAFPNFALSTQKNTETEIYTAEKGLRFATSIGGSLTGYGGSLIIVDDPIKPGEVMSEAEREKVNRFYRETLITRLDNKNTGAVIIVMQRVHEDDLIGHVLGLDDWDVLNLPAIATQDEEIQTGPYPARDHHRNPAGNIDDTDAHPHPAPPHGLGGSATPVRVCGHETGGVGASSRIPC